MGYIDNNFWSPLGFTHAEKYSLALKKLQDLCGDLAPETIPQSSLQPQRRCLYLPLTETSLENFITPMKNEFSKKRGDESFIPIANLTSQAQHSFLGSRVTAIFLRNLLIFSMLDHKLTVKVRQFKMIFILCIGEMSRSQTRDQL